MRAIATISASEPTAIFLTISRSFAAFYHEDTGVPEFDRRAQRSRILGSTLATLGRYEEALKEYDQCGPPHADIFKLRVIALVQLGRLEEARAQVRALLALRPEMTTAKIQKRDACMPDVDVRIESLRLAGLPE